MSDTPLMKDHHVEVARSSDPAARKGAGSGAGAGASAPAERFDANGILVGAWDVSLFDCFTDLVPNCFLASFLPFISIAQIAQRLDIARYGNVLVTFLVLYMFEIVCTILGLAVSARKYQLGSADASATDDPLFDALAQQNLAPDTVWMLLNIAYTLAIWQLRTKVRERFEIPGTCFEDYLVVWWCSCCSIAQMATHVKSYEPGRCDFGPPDTLPAYE